MLRKGQTAPSFSLPDADMQTVSLASYKGRKNIVLYFYPRDGTPGCTLEAIEFSDHDEQFGRHDCVILGVSRDDCMVHAEFRDRNGLSINLLSDFDGAVCRKYGVLQEKESDGNKRLFLVRSTFVIDKKGVLRHVEYGVNPRGHAAGVLDAVRKLKS
jgi:peroxiredoxin Q/BCP